MSSVTDLREDSARCPGNEPEVYLVQSFGFLQSADVPSAMRRSFRDAYIHMRSFTHTYKNDTYTLGAEVENSIG